jgi:hypothetical protein
MNPVFYKLFYTTTFNWGATTLAARRFFREKGLSWNSERKTLELFWCGFEKIIRIQIERQPYQDHDGERDKAKTVVDLI